ncbi:MAG TPA: isoprenylcysteine carboxylmethyltransferase family protein [Candidatus Dormibacteraeota bacterium]
MPRAVLALALCLVYDGVVFVGHPLLLRGRRAAGGWLRPTSGPPAERAANLLFAVACALDIAGPCLVLAGRLRPLPLPRRLRTCAAAAGMVVSGANLVVAVGAQRSMGRAWRTGVAGTEGEQLVTSGAFRVVRNPVYVSLLGSCVGQSLVLATAMTPAALATCLGALELQTRAVEEPALLAAHPEAFRRYAARVGRFAPGIGRLRDLNRGSGSAGSVPRG